jgi:hypothetical protein
VPNVELEIVLLAIILWLIKEHSLLLLPWILTKNDPMFETFLTQLTILVHVQVGNCQSVVSYVGWLEQDIPSLTHKSIESHPHL